MSNLLYQELPPPHQDIYLYINHLEQNISHTNKIMVSSSHELKTTADSN